VSLEGAEDVSAEPTLAAAGLTPLVKSLVFDLVNCPPSGANDPNNPDPHANPLLDNFEAMTLGPHLPGGRRALILMSDDNLSGVQTTRVVAIALQTKDLVGNEQ
jgi:hypothetical protein